MKLLSAFVSALSLGWLIAVIVNAVHNRAGAALFCFALFLFFALSGWFLSPLHHPNHERIERHLRRQNHFFRRIGLQSVVWPEEGYELPEKDKT